MADLDLDIIVGKQRTVRLLGKDIKFKNINMEEYLLSELLIQELDKIPMENKKDIAKGMKIIREYIMTLLEIELVDAKQITLEQFKAFRQFMSRKDMYDQGYNDKEIDEIEKSILKNQMAQINSGI